MAKSKRTYKCPYCHQWFRDVKGHIARMHKGESPEQKAEAEPKGKGKTLELKTPPKKEKTETAQGYHCIDCGAAVTKGQNPCSCGATLDWSSL